MSKTCSICQHDNREQIDRALLDHEPYRTIAARTGTSAAALHRHRWQHLPARLASNQTAAEIRAESFHDRFDAIKRAASTVLAGALRSGNNALALQAMTRIEKQLALEAELLSRLREPLKTALGLCSTDSERDKPDISKLTDEEQDTVLTLLKKATPDSAGK